MSEQPEQYKGSLESRQTKSEADIGSLIVAFRDFQADFKAFVRSVSDRAAKHNGRR